MRNTVTDGTSLFDPHAFLTEKETSLATAALILGLDITNFDAITIDDLVAAARSVFPMQPRPLTSRLFDKSVGVGEKQLNPAYLWNKKKQQQVLHKIRCDWRDRHMAKWVIENG